MKPIISSPGIGLQHLARWVNKLPTPSTINGESAVGSRLIFLKLISDSAMSAAVLSLLRVLICWITVLTPKLPVPIATKISSAFFTLKRLIALLSMFLLIGSWRVAFSQTSKPVARSRS